jgi:prepilin-type processing-associated H-X9-DG protein
MMRYQWRGFGKPPVCFSWFPTYMTPNVSWCSPGNFVGWNAPHRDATNWIFADGHVEGSKYIGTYQSQGSAFKAIADHRKYTKKVTYAQNSAPTADEFFWSRAQNDLAK